MIVSNAFCNEYKVEFTDGSTTDIFARDESEAAILARRSPHNPAVKKVTWVSQRQMKFDYVKDAERARKTPITLEDNHTKVEFIV